MAENLLTAKIQSAETKGRLPNPPVLFGRYKRGEWAWSFRPASNHLSSQDRFDFNQGFLIAIEVPKTVQNLSLDDLIELLVPADKKPAKAA